MDLPADPSPLFREASLLYIETNLPMWEKLVENHAQLEAFAHEKVVEFYRGLVYPFSTRANDDDRDAIVSDVSDDEDIEGMSMHAAFDQSREAVGKIFKPFLVSDTPPESSCSFSVISSTKRSLV